MQLQRGFGGGNKGAEELHHGSRRVARRVPPALPESQHLRENRVTALVRGAPFTFAARKFPSTVVLFLGPVSWQMADLLERVRASLAGRYVRAAAPSDGARSVTAAAPHFVGSSVAWPPPVLPAAVPLHEDINDAARPGGISLRRPPDG